MASNGTHFSNVNASAPNATAPTSLPYPGPNHDPDLTNRVILALVGGVLFIALWLLFCCHDRFVKTPLQNTATFWQPGDRVDIHPMYPAFEQEEAKEILTVKELNHGFPVQKYTSRQGFAQMRDPSVGSSCLCSASNSQKLNSILDEKELKEEHNLHLPSSISSSNTIPELENAATAAQSVSSKFRTLS